MTEDNQIEIGSLDIGDCIYMYGEEYVIVDPGRIQDAVSDGEAIEEISYYVWCMGLDSFVIRPIEPSESVEFIVENAVLERIEK
jgi:hypothetical protein